MDEAFSHSVRKHFMGFATAVFIDLANAYFFGAAGGPGSGEAHKIDTSHQQDKYGHDREQAHIGDIALARYIIEDVFGIQMDLVQRLELEDCIEGRLTLFIDRPDVLFDGSKRGCEHQLPNLYGLNMNGGDLRLAFKRCSYFSCRRP